MKCLLLLLAALLAIPTPTPAAPAKPPTIRGLFVGIDKYLYSQPDSEFRDLKGAVGDVGRIKAALRTAYRLDLDQPKPGQCLSQNTVSITLIDTCATRAAILGNLQKQIDASAPGDTLIFYYAGHGSQIADDQVFDQASGMNDTILPTDARKPGAETDGDILDRELRGYIDEATVKGVNVVTIFDSCDSGSGVRGGVSIDPGEDRAAPPLTARKLERPAPPIARGPGGGYRVHLAASQDGEVARETALTEGVRAGVFTTALARTLIAMPNATFGDIMAEVSLRVGESGHPGQNPQIEGAATATLGGKEGKVALFDAAPRDGAVTLTAGELSGMTSGSTFAFFATASDALADGGKPVATGTITAVAAATATVKLDAAPVTALPSRLVAREVSHAYGTATVNVRNGVWTDADKAIVARALAGLPFVRVAEPPTFLIEMGCCRKPDTYLLSVDGISMLKLGSIKAPDFADKLRTALQRVMRAQALLALRTGGSGEARPGFCIDNDLAYDPRRCPQQPQGKPFALTTDAKAKLTVTNTADTPRHLYVYAIDDTYEVNLLLPAGGGKDPPLLPGMSVNVVVEPTEFGRYRFVTISTAADAPIGSAKALEQSGARGAGACVSALERLICEATSGTRDPGVPRVGAWVASVTEVAVEFGKNK